MTAEISIPDRFNVADYYILPHQTPERAMRPYLYCGEEQLTYGALHEGANKVGNALKKLGVEPEQRVMLLMLESLSFPTCFWGTLRIGAVAVPVNTMLASKDYLYFLNDSRAKVLIVDAALWPQIEPIEDQLEHQRQIVIANGTAPGKASLDDLLAPESAELEVVLMNRDDPAF